MSGSYMALEQASVDKGYHRLGHAEYRRNSALGIACRKAQPDYSYVGLGQFRTAVSAASRHSFWIQPRAILVSARHSFRVLTRTICVATRRKASSFPIAVCGVVEGCSNPQMRWIYTLRT